MKRKDLLINDLEKPLIISKTIEFLKKIKTNDSVTENMEVYDDNPEQVCIEMDLHLGIFDVQNPVATDGTTSIAKNSLNSDDAASDSSESEISESDSLLDDASEETSSDEEQVGLIEEIE